MRCGSATTAVCPAACSTGPGGTGSSRAGSGAHDSSGRRWLPSTPAPAIFVVLVTGLAVAPDCGGSVRPEQPLVSVMADGAQRRRSGHHNTRTNPAEPHAADVNIRAVSTR